MLSHVRNNVGLAAAGNDSPGEAVVNRKHLKESDSAAESSFPALLTSTRFVNSRVGEPGIANRLGFGGCQLTWLAAFGAQPSNEPLGHTQSQRRRHLIGQKSHIRKAGDRSGC